MLDQDSNPVFFDFYMLTGGALGDKQHVSSSDFLLLSYGAYIDVNFVVTDLQIVTSKCHRSNEPTLKRRNNSAYNEKWHCSLEWHFNHNLFPPKIRWYKSREYQDLKPLKQCFANLESFLLQLKAYGINAHLSIFKGTC
ncbi:uncharacterized protein LOC136064545 [Quercus suber]|uniref:uncharacterized protein LOC136064545 n=1 Tax=Quercus suber TaxID=58331 RepID=UPI0032DE41D0